LPSQDHGVGVTGAASDRLQAGRGVTEAGLWTCLVGSIQPAVINSSSWTRRGNALQRSFLVVV